jgi:ABC-type multidrug transport system fused ATPase/permease subunit
MTSERGEPEQRLDDMVRDASEYYDNLRRKHASQTKLDVAVVSVVVWFASFAVIGIGALLTVKNMPIGYIVAAFLAAIVIGLASGLVTYIIRRRRGFKFAELGALLTKMKEGPVTAEDGLRLVDAMHQAAVVSKKRKMDSAVEWAIVAFVVVAIVGLNPAIGALAGVIVYLYLRFETLRESEKEEKRYEDSKKDLLQSL